MVREHKDGSYRKRENTDNKMANKKKCEWKVRKTDRQTKVIKEERKGCGNCNLKVENNGRTDKRGMAERRYKGMSKTEEISKWDKQ